MRSASELMGRAAVWIVSVVFLVGLAQTQAAPYERAFPQSKQAIEKALTPLQTSLAGHLPVLDGFAQPGERPLDRYQRGYYQSTVQVSSTPSGGSIVRITTKVTAWYADPAGTQSGYQLLTSNGRLEADLLDQLAEQLAKVPAESNSPVPAVAAPKPKAEPPAVAESSGSAAVHKFPETDRTFSSPVSQGLAADQLRTRARPADTLSDKSNNALQTEAENLEEILKNTAHPKNLVAVKKSGTPVVASPTLTAKPQFLASMHDEFELLDFNADWVHVRISGLSRGWIWRNSVEMPNGIADTTATASAAMPSAGDLFHVIREEASTFPGDWEPLKNKNVKIVSVQKVDENAKNAGAAERLEYAKFLLEKSYKEIAQKPQDLAGVVVIFDSADGGMIAATMPTLQQWTAGTLSDSALWHKCFFDPPETFDSAAASGSR